MTTVRSSNEPEAGWCSCAAAAVPMEPVEAAGSQRHAPDHRFAEAICLAGLTTCNTANLTNYIYIVIQVIAHTALEGLVQATVLENEPLDILSF